MFKSFIRLVSCATFLVIAQPAFSVTTGMEFAGGCVENSTTALCQNGANANTDNVAAILGIDESAVSQITTGFTVDPIGGTDGTWSITDTSITHIAFKSNGYFILGAINPGTTTGLWDNDPSSLGEWDITNVDCPASICGSDRAYTLADFENNGGNIAALSNVRAFSVVPVPAAVWLFGSALGMLGWMRRRSSAVA